METAKSNINFDELRKEFISITTSSKTLETMYNKSRLVDLDKIGVMLAETRERINTLRRRKGFVGSVCSKLPLISKITKVTTIEANLQKSINDYTTEMADVFDKKYDEITQYLDTLQKLQDQFVNEINNINLFVKKLENLNVGNSLSDQAKLMKILSEAKAEAIRKISTLNSLIKPTITLANELIVNINNTLPILKDKVYTELKTLVGLNSFRDSAKMLNEFKSQIVELEKLNTKARTETLIEILNSIESNLMSKEDFEELDKLRSESDNEVKEALKNLMNKQQQNQKYILDKYNDLDNTGKLIVKKVDEDYIDAMPIEADSNRPEFLNLRTQS